MSHLVGTVQIMREISDVELSRVLAEASHEARAQEFQSAVTVAAPLRAIAVDEDDPVSALVVGLEYHLVIDVSARRDHGAFGPMIEAGGRVYPAPLDRIREDVLVLWGRASDLASIAAVRARYSDLLWEARYGSRSFERAQRAVDEYLKVPTDDFGDFLQQSEALQRAWEIATQLNDVERRNTAIAALVDLAERALASRDDVPGVVLRILAFFAARSREERPPALGALVQGAIDRYGDDPWHLESALDIKAELVEPEERPAIHMAQVDALANLARSSTGLISYAHFQHAVELAEEHGLGDRADQLRREIEQIPGDALDLKLFTAEVEVPREDIEHFIDGIVGDDDLDAALTRFGAYVPTGDVERNREFVQSLALEFPLHRLFSTMVVGPENSLLSVVDSEEEKEEYALTQHEAQQIQFFSLLAVEILERIQSRYGVKAVAELFSTSIIAPAVAARIERAFELYFEGDTDGAASVLVPRLERIIREIARTTGISITQSPRRDGAPGGVRALGDLLSRLDGRLDESTRRYLRCLLSEIKGVNLRNRIGHGLVDEATQRDTALLLHAVCHLRLLRPIAEADAHTLSDRLRNPTE